MDSRRRPVARGGGLGGRKTPPPLGQRLHRVQYKGPHFYQMRPPPLLGVRSTFPPNKTPLGNPGYGPASWNERIHVRGKTRTSIACDQSHPIDVRQSHRFRRTCAWGFNAWTTTITAGGLYSIPLYYSNVDYCYIPLNYVP